MRVHGDVIVVDHVRILRFSLTLKVTIRQKKEFGFANKFFVTFLVTLSIILCRGRSIASHRSQQQQQSGAVGWLEWMELLLHLLRTGGEGEPIFHMYSIRVHTP